MAPMKMKARRKRARSVYSVSFRKPEFEFLRHLSDQSPEEFVASLGGAAGPIVKIYRTGNKRIVAGLAYIYGIYSTLRQLPARRCEEFLEALAGQMEKRVRKGDGGSTQLAAEPIHVLLRGMIDYGQAYSTSPSARQALHRDANALRYAEVMKVPVEGFLDFARHEGLGADAMSRAYTDMRAAVSRTSAARPVAEIGVPSKTDPAATKAPPKSTKTFILEIDGQKAMLAVPVTVGAGGGFHFFGIVNDKGELVVTDTGPAEFNPSGQATRRSLSGLKSQVQRAESAARFAEREALQTADNEKSDRG